MSVIDPHVRVDGVPDWRTTDDLLASVVREGMSDEERVLAVFHTVRRMQVHGPTPPDLAYDFHKVMHVLGTGACLKMTPPLHMLFGAITLRPGERYTRTWHPGEHFYPRMDSLTLEA